MRGGPRGQLGAAEPAARAPRAPRARHGGHLPALRAHLHARPVRLPVGLQAVGSHFSPLLLAEVTSRWRRSVLEDVALRFIVSIVHKGDRILKVGRMQAARNELGVLRDRNGRVPDLHFKGRLLVLQDMDDCLIRNVLD